MGGALVVWLAARVDEWVEGVDGCLGGCWWGGWPPG